MTDYEKYKEYQRNYRENHREHIRQLCQKWRANHPDYYKTYDKQHRSERAKSTNQWREQNGKKFEVHKLITNHREDYPLEKQCIFCGAISNLEHAHLDYEDKGVNYVTACHACNTWMGIE